MDASIYTPGRIALLGSGETTTAGGQVYEALARDLPTPLRVRILETPAGFELNSAQVAGRVADYMGTRLQNYAPDVRLVPARRRGTDFSPDDPTLLEPLLEGHVLYMGAGSPSYAVRQLAGSLAWEWVRARHRLGAALIFASAAAIAAGARALPVYEIYKVGEDPHWKPGLDLLADYGLRLVIVSHWNNNEGGADLDTSRCFVGQARFQPLLEQISPQETIMGLDEQTALVIDLAARSCQVMGRDQVHILRGGQEQVFSRGETFPADLLGDLRLPVQPSAGIRPDAWQAAAEAHALAALPVEHVIPHEVIALVEERARARAGKNWQRSDMLRRSIGELGYRVTDTPDGPKIEPL